MLRPVTQILSKVSACTALVLALTACGGDGSSNSATPEAAAKPQLHGVAAIGAPVSGGTVDCKCASGKNASARTSPDGSFGVEVTDSDLPCALRVAGGTADGKPLDAPLHSVARTMDIANITPLTDRLVQKLVGHDYAKWFANATQGDIGATITAEKLEDAFGRLKYFLALLPGVPALSTDFHPVTTPFKAQKGDATVDLLERFGSALRATDREFGKDTSSIAAGIRTTYQGHAFTVPGWTNFPIRIKKLSNDSEMLIIPDPNLGNQFAVISARDAEGNITALDRDAPFTSILSLLGNRIGMLSGRDSRFKNTVSEDDESSAHYVYLSDEFKEVDHRELLGSRFAMYADSKYLTDIVLGTDGKLRTVEDLSAPAVDVDQWFTAEGMRAGEHEEATILRSKAYKYTANGKTTYVVVSVKALDPDVPEALPANQGVGLAVSR